MVAAEVREGAHTYPLNFMEYSNMRRDLESSFTKINLLKPHSPLPASMQVSQTLSGVFSSRKSLHWQLKKST